MPTSGLREARVCYPEALAHLHVIFQPGRYGCLGTSAALT